MNDYFPQGFEELRSPQSYWRMKEMSEGDNLLRILIRPIAGWIDWEANKPYRFRPENKPATSFDPQKPVRPFWTCYVWDYCRNDLFILEITQSSILKTLAILGHDKDWGDFRNYDIKINKKGAGKDTKYQVIPCPPKALDAAIVKALKEAPVNLDVLFQGGDPWNDFPKGGAEAIASTSSQDFLKKAEEMISSEEAEELDRLIGDNQEYRQNVINFLFSNFDTKSIKEMPQKVYPQIFDRASKLAQAEGLPF